LGGFILFKLRKKIRQTISKQKVNGEKRTFGLNPDFNKVWIFYADN